MGEGRQGGWQEGVGRGNASDRRPNRGKIYDDNKLHPPVRGNRIIKKKEEKKRKGRMKGETSELRAESAAQLPRAVSGYRNSPSSL